MLSPRFKSLILVPILGFLVSGCATTLGSSDAELEAEAVRQFAKMRAELPLVEDRATIDYVHCVATAVVESLEEPHRDMAWDLAIFETQMANAFVMPGGKIGVFSGLLDIATNQDQLAAVLGHEAAHVIARHPNERSTRGNLTDDAVYIAAIVLGQGRWGLTQTAYQIGRYGADITVLKPHSRDQETEADVLGLEYMANAGFDPRESVELWKKMAEDKGNAPPEFLSTHPSSDTRIENLISEYPKTLKLMNEAKEQGKSPNCTR